MKVYQLFRPAWHVAMVLFVVHQLTQDFLSWKMPLVDNYLDPLLSIPLILGIMTTERKAYFGANRMSALETIVLTVFLAVLFEEVFTRLKLSFSRDAYDYIAYVLGGIYFWIFVNPPAR